MILHAEVTFEVGGTTFTFPLLHKREVLGAVAVDQWWVDARTLYGQRGRADTTLRAFADCFRALCRHHGTHDDPDVQEVFLLAGLLPLTRGNAARRVFNDARVFPARGPRAGDKARDAADLGRILRQDPHGRKTFLQFKDGTAQVLGPPRLAPDLIERYHAFASDFLGDARAALTGGADDGLRVAAAGWQKAIRSWGRRRGFADEKRVLDVLSYEARAALHQCYSAVWVELLPRLVERHGLDETGRQFHQLWHLDHVREPAPGAPARTHLFHGHVFALHPAGGLLLSTPEGRDRVGDWLAAGDDRGEAFERLLHALFLAVHHYAGVHATAADDRRATTPETEPPSA